MAGTTVGTSTSANPLSQNANLHGPFYGNGKWWLIWFDGTNLVYSSCSTLTGSWATKATVVAGISSLNSTCYSDGTYIHLAYYSSSVIYYRQLIMNSNGTLTIGSASTAVSSATAPGICLSICVTSDSHVAIGYANASHYPTVTKNSNATSSATWATASGFPAVLKTTVYYEPQIFPGPSGAIYGCYCNASSTTALFFNQVSSAGSVGTQETASLANCLAGDYCMAVDSTTGLW
jgi:hypothetical protein